MKTFFYTLILLLPFVAISCKKNNSFPEGNNPEEPANQKMQHVRANGNALVTEDGKPFKVWGFNWGNGLLEDYWTSNWDALVGDFKEMKQYGANTVRIALQYEAFMDNATTPNSASIEKLKKLVAVAEENQLYLIVCGLNAFKKENQPAWYNSMNEQQRWETQSLFWEAVAKAVGHSPAILTYDLMNEPVVAVDPQNGWLPGKGMGGYFFVQNIALTTNGAPLQDVIRLWIAKMGGAIRKHDQQHFITVGFLSFPMFSQFSKDLPMMSTHLYPKSGEMNLDATSVQKFKSDKPLIISEIFPMNCSDTELEQFIVEQNKNVSGWVWHYNGKTAEELQASGTISDAIYRIALLKFAAMAPKQK